MSYKKCSNEKCRNMISHSNKSGICFWCRRKDNFQKGLTLNWGTKPYTRRYDMNGDYMYVIK